MAAEATTRAAARSREQVSRGTDPRTGLTAGRIVCEWMVMGSVRDIGLVTHHDREFARLSFELGARRDCGQVFMEYVDVPHGSAEPLVLDALAVRVGGSPLGDDWRTVSRDDAEVLLVRVFARDLAMNAPIMPEEDARGFARRFLALFGASARFFTNTSMLDEEEDVDATWTGSWKPLTSATFDTGIAVVDGARAGLCWVTDDD